MFTQEEYLSAWGIYLLASLLFLFGLWKLLALFKWRELKFLVGAPAAAFFLLPWSISEGSEFRSPAWVTAILEGFLQGGAAFWRAGGPLLIAALIALLVASILCATNWYIASRSADQATV